MAEKPSTPRTKVTPEELKRIKEKYGARKAQADERKKTARQEGAARTKATKERISKESLDQAIAASEAKSNAFKQTLASGAPLPSSMESGLTYNSPTQITDNSNYHNALYSMIGDFENRISRIRNDDTSAAKKDVTVAANKAGVPVDRYLDKSGKRKSFVSADTSKKLLPAERLIAQARKHLDNSVAANKAGGADGALTAVESFTKAGDTLAAALNHVHENFGTSQKYKKVFTTGDFGDKDSPVNIDIGSKSVISDIVNGHNEHVLNRATSVGTLPQEVTQEVKPVLKRDYDTVLPVPEVTAAAGRYAPKTDEEKAADAQSRADRRQSRLETAAKEKAEKGLANIVKPSEDGYGPTDGVFDASSRATPVSIDTGIPGAPSLNPVITGGVSANKLGNPVDHGTRWRRAQVQPVFEKNEEDNANSAAEVGKQYTKKTFVGSEAHTNPAQWHVRNQVRSHWLATTKGARPEDFESSEANQDPMGYIASRANSPRPVEIKPLEFDTKKASRLTVFTPNPKSTIEKLIFKQPEVDSNPDTPKKVSFEPFHPTNAQSTAAEENNQIDIPETVNTRQKSKAARAGALLSRKNVSFDEAGFQTKDTEEEPTSEPGVYDPNPEKATTKSVAEAEASKIVGRPVSLNVHFTDGAGK